MSILATAAVLISTLCSGQLHPDLWVACGYSIQKWSQKLRPFFEGRILICHYKSIIIFDDGVEVQMSIQSLFDKSLSASERELESSTRRMIFSDQATCRWELGSDAMSRYVNFGAWKNRKKITIEPKCETRLSLLLERTWDLRESPVQFSPLSPKSGIAVVAYLKDLTFHEVEVDGEFPQRSYCVIGFGNPTISYQRGIKSAQKDTAVVLK